MLTLPYALFFRASLAKCTDAGIWESSVGESHAATFKASVFKDKFWKCAVGIGASSFRAAHYSVLILRVQEGDQERS